MSQIIISPYAFPGIREIEVEKRQTLSRDELNRLLFNALGMSIGDVSTKSRKAEHVSVRRVVSYFLYTVVGLNQSIIADLVGLTNHTSVHHYIDKHKTLEKNDQLSDIEIETFNKLRTEYLFK